MAEHQLGRPGPKDVRVINAISACEGGVDEGHRLDAGVGPPRRVAQVHVAAVQLLQAEVLGQGGRQDEPGVGHQVRVVELHGQRVLGRPLPSCCPGLGQYFCDGPPPNTLCVNLPPKKLFMLPLVHSRGGCEFPQPRTLAEALLGGLSGDPECHSQLTPGVPETSGCNHGAGELLLGCCELSHRRLDGLQGAPVASMDEGATDHALAHGGAPGIAAGTQRHRSVGDHGAMLAVGTEHRVIGVAARGLCVNGA